ncbi:MAG: tetratricopeptide repeat protein [Anaerolineae bacterium]
MSIDLSFGTWLKRRRHSLGLTQVELAQKTGYSSETIRKVEADEFRPSRQLAEALAATLDIAPSDRDRFIQFARGVEPEVAVSLPSEPAPIPPPLPLDRHNLPAPPTPLIGRNTEVATVVAMMQGGNARLLTLTGAGGTGKTRLALAAASELLGCFPDGVYFVDLAPIRDPALVVSAVARTLDVRETPTRPYRQALEDHLREKSVLLLLDNFEQVLDAASALADLLAAAPRVRMLVTSREVLHLRAERVYPVEPLAVPPPGDLPSVEQLTDYPAVALFVQRAAAASPNFHLRTDNAAAVAEICARLDGLPLAIELAAARARLLSPEEILHRLTRRLTILSDGYRDLPRRQQTLRDTLAWSYDLLDEEEKTLFRRFAVFAGGATTDALEVVGGGNDIAPVEALNLLGRLVEKSLVLMETRGADARYRMLETIHEYALERLEESGEADAVRRRHAEHYLTLVAAAGGDLEEFETTGPRPDWFARVEADNANVRAALACVQESPANRDLEMRFIIPLLINLPPEKTDNPHQVVETALAHARESQARAQEAYILYAQAYYLAGLKQFEAAYARYGEAMEVYRELGDRRQEAEILGGLGIIAREQGDAASARRWLEESIALFRQLGDEGGVATAVLTLGEVAILQEDAAWAKSLLEEPLRIFRAQGNIQMAGWALNHLGHAAQLEGDFEHATRLLEESLGLFRVVGMEVPNIACDLQSLGDCALGLGDPTLAKTHFVEALKLFYRYGDMAGAAWCLAGLAGVAALERHPKRAARLWAAAESVQQAIGARSAPAARAIRERLTAAVQERLGETEFAAASDEGRGMTLEEAVGYAMENAECLPRVTQGADA